MADQAKDRSAESEIGRDVLYVMTDGKTVRPAKILALEEPATEGDAPRALLAIFTAGKLDRGLIEHHERVAFDGTDMEPALLVRAGVPFAGARVDGAWPRHTFHASQVARVSSSAPTERPPAATTTATEGEPAGNDGGTERT